MSHVQSGGKPDIPVLQLHDVCKSFGSVVALQDVNIAVRRGTIHGLLGENGAGKSTMVGLIAGQRAPTSGRILFDGREVHGCDVKAMEQHGVFLVRQEPMIVEQMSIGENLLLGRWPALKGGFIDWKQLRQKAREMLEGLALDPDALAGTLGAVDRRKLNILRALFSGGRLIILDEPTTSLTMADRTVLFDFMRNLRSRGITFIFISHYNEEILDICDAVTVLRDGSVAGGSDGMAGMSSEYLSELVLGRGLQLFRRDRDHDRSNVVGLEVEGVMTPTVRVDRFSIAAGEVVGFAGLPGSGAKEFAQALFGLVPGIGQVRSAGHKESGLPAGPAKALKLGIAYLSDDRRRDGVVGLLSIGQNISLSSLPALSLLGFLRRHAEGSLIGHYFRGLAVKASDAGVIVDTLSGGNQQKVCLARLLATSPKLLILDEPTRGIDVGVKEDVHRIIDDLTKHGLSVIVVTTDLDEMSRVSDRVCVFRDGAIVEMLHGVDITTDRLREAAFSTQRQNRVTAVATSLNDNATAV